MNADIVIDKTIEQAEKNHQDFLEAKFGVVANYLKAGEFLNDNLAHAYFKVLGYDSFEEYLGTPDVAMGRSKAYGLIQIYKTFVEKLGVPGADLLEIGTSKLLLIAPVVESDKDEWIAKAKHLSKSDLKAELQGRVAGTKKLPPLSKPPTPSPGLPPKMTPGQYVRHVERSPCCVCGRSPVVKAHFPRTRVRANKPWYVIPLCGECHAEQEGHKDWMWAYREKWGDWFFNNIAEE